VLAHSAAPEITGHLDRLALPATKFCASLKERPCHGARPPSAATARLSISEATVSRARAACGGEVGFGYALGPTAKRRG